MFLRALFVRFTAMLLKHKLLVIGFISGFLIVFTLSHVKSNHATITIDSTIKYQTMIGWEATAQAGQLACDSKDFIQGNLVMCPAFENIRDTLFNSLVNDLGVSRLRVEIYPGVENPTDYFAQYLSGQISEHDWVHVYGTQIINDNNDPNVINPAGFHFTSFDYKIDTVVLPIKRLLESRGEKLFFNACYVDFNKNYSDYHHYDHPQEYAEFVLATYEHMQSKYGFVPDTWELELEPDNTNFNGTKMGQAIVVPSTTNMDNALPYFNAIKAVIGEAAVKKYIVEISYHRYAGGSSIQSIGNTAQSYGIGGAMLEWIGAGYSQLHDDLTLGMNSSWSQYTIAKPYYWGSSDDGSAYYLINDTNPDSPTLILASRTKFLRQYFKFIKPGAVRIMATSDNDVYNPVAFINTDGKYVVVVKANQAGDLGIQGIPAGSYGIKYTTKGQYDINLLDVTIESGQSLSANIPDTGVITLYAKSPSPTPSPAN
jgi:hypothetical protein